MTIRDFFKIVIKLFGLYQLIYSVFTFYPYYLGYMISEFDWSIFLYSFGALLLSVAFFLFLVFKSDYVIDLLKLDRGFDEKSIVFQSISNNSLIKFSCILLGGWLILAYASEFISHSFFAFRNTIQKDSFYKIDLLHSKKPDYFEWSIATLNLLIGYLLITNYKTVSNWFEKK